MQGLLIKRERIAQNMSQQALCAGICTPSYLSKVENGNAQCSEEMYALLFDALNITYTTDAGLLEKFNSAFEAFYDQITGARKLPKGEEADALISLCRRLRYSPRGVDASLMECLLRRKSITAQDIDLLSFFASAFDGRQALLFALVGCNFYRQAKRYQESIDCLMKVKTADNPVVYAELLQDYFLIGAYRQAVETGAEAYRMYAARGQIEAMLDVAMLIAAASSNTMDYDQMMGWHTVCRNINSVVGSDVVAWTEYYNEGASCLMYGEYAHGLRCLLEGLPLTERYTEEDPAQCDMYYQKLAFAWIFNQSPEKASAAIACIRQPGSQKSLEASLDLMRYMLREPNYQQKKAYCELLEVCLSAAEQEARGRLEFYGYFLIGAYKATRQYKKAMQLMEKYKLSHLFR